MWASKKEEKPTARALTWEYSGWGFSYQSVSEKSNTVIIKSKS